MPENKNSLSFFFGLFVIIISLTGITSLAFAQQNEPYHQAVLIEASDGNAGAMYYVAQNYAQGLDVSPDLERAFHWYKQAALHGHALAKHHVGQAYLHGLGTTPDPIKAKHWLHQAANQDIAQSQFEYGQLIESQHNNSEAIEWYEKAAQNGYIPAMNRLGEIFYRGLGTELDRKRGKIYYHQAANLGDKVAQFKYGSILYEEARIFKFYPKARHYLVQSAQQSYAPAQSLLGRLYLSPGIQQNYHLAQRYLHDAAAQSDILSLTTLGEMYRYGQGVKPDLKRSFQYYYRAAQLGNVEAQALVGLSYQVGNGTPQNYQQAAYWYNRAASQGNFQAQYNLGTLYTKGQGVERDKIRAYAWINLAAENGLDTARQARLDLKHRLNTTELNRAQALSLELNRR